MNLASPAAAPLSSFLVELDSISISPDETHSFNSLRVCQKPTGCHMKLSTLRNTHKLVTSKLTPFKLVKSTPFAEPKGENPKEEIICSSDIISGNYENWDDHHDNTTIEAIAIQSTKPATPPLFEPHTSYRIIILQTHLPPQTLELTFAPLVLHLTYLPLNATPTLTLLVSSATNPSTIRVYQCLNPPSRASHTVPSPTNLFSPSNTNILPQIQSTFPSPILTIDTTTTTDATNDHTIYHVALGMKDGNVSLYSFDTATSAPTPASLKSFHIDGPISTVQLSPPPTNSPSQTPHLLVSSMAGFACVYAAATPRLLPRSDASPVLCVYHAPFPTPSGSAIFLGTFDGNVCMYEGKESFCLETGMMINRCLFTRCLNSPIHRFGVGDINGDGVAELVVVTKQSVHVFRPEVNSFKDVT